MSRRLLFAVVGALALGGCATIPQPLQGNYAPVSLNAARSSTSATSVRWGGKIIQTEPRQQQTCFFVLAQPLDSQARPERGNEDSLGRFVACKQGFYDPEVFRKDREITVTGTLAGTIQHKIGEFDYTYPKVEANNVYLWPKRPLYVQQPYYSPWGMGYDPFWGGPWGPWGWGGPGYYYSPRVIVVPRAPPPPPKKG